METTYRLKPAAIWHDGTPLSAEDFVFAWQVYTAPQIGIAAVPPQSLMSEVVAQDSKTLVIRWSRPYPGAGTLDEDTFPPLPRHLLETAFQQEPADLANQPYFTREFVGIGPYRLARWEPGAFIEATSFEGHALGRAKIERVRITFVPDANAALANLLSGEAHFATDSSIRFEQGLTLRREWGSPQVGSVLMRPESFRAAWIQRRSGIANPRALLDLRVRRALAHSIDRQAVNEGIFHGQGIMTEAPFIPPTVSYVAEVDRAIAKYPYDVRVAEQLMADAGFRKGADGSFASPSEGRLQFEVQTLANAERETEMAILADGWRQAGFDFSETTLPASRSGDAQARATFRSLFTYSTGEGEYSLSAINTANIGTPENRWIGTNRVGWSNDDFDRASSAFRDAIAQTERVRYIAEMARVFTTDLPAIPLLYDMRVYAYVAALRGPQIAAQETSISWNFHEWEFQ
jgi:peptide/nickel transport system substrate-binding protein